MKQLFLCLALACTQQVTGQNHISYKQSILQYRQKYKEDFLSDKRSPLTEKDTVFLAFFEPDSSYCVSASIQQTPNAQPFDIQTASGKKKRYRQYGIITFRLHDTTLTLHVYQSLKLLKEQEYKDHLFIPFTDATTYGETYGGGRYLDLSTNDIKDGYIKLDFNKCYNPWCAFASGYSCPIPPPENKLPVAINAGEKNYTKKH